MNVAVKLWAAYKAIIGKESVGCLKSGVQTGHQSTPAAELRKSTCKIIIITMIIITIIIIIIIINIIIIIVI